MATERKAFNISGVVMVPLSDPDVWVDYFMGRGEFAPEPGWFKLGPDGENLLKMLADERAQDDDQEA